MPASHYMLWWQTVSCYWGAWCVPALGKSRCAGGDEAVHVGSHVKAVSVPWYCAALFPAPWGLSCLWARPALVQCIHVAWDEAAVKTNVWWGAVICRLGGLFPFTWSSLWGWALAWAALWVCLCLATSLADPDPLTWLGSFTSSLLITMDSSGNRGSLWSCLPLLDPLCFFVWALSERGHCLVCFVITFSCWLTCPCCSLTA